MSRKYVPNCYIGALGSDVLDARENAESKVWGKMGRMVHYEAPTEEGELGVWVFEFLADVLDDVDENLWDHFDLPHLANMPYEQV